MQNYVKKEKYMSIVRHYEECLENHGDTFAGVDWPKEEDAYKRYQVMLDVMKFDKTVIRFPSVLDFGCGLGFMYKYILDKGLNINYKGVDISDKYLSVCKKKYPSLDFQKIDIMKEQYEHKHDYIIANGVFTEKGILEYTVMKEYFMDMIRKLYSMCRRGLAFNVMSKDVDWERDDLFHLPLNELSEFLTKNVTRNYIIRNDYGLYEYTTYLYK